MNPRLIDRVRSCNQKPVNTEGKYILYWMISSRRFNSNAALEYAAHLAEQHGVPLLVLEEISTSHQYANDRICTFMIQGMLENIRIFKDNNIRYVPWVETPLSGHTGKLHDLSKEAVMIVTDDFPTYFPSKAVRHASRSIARNMVAVDSNGVFPMSWTERAYPTAHGFRRFVHQNFVECMETWPQFNPVSKDHSLWLDDELYSSLSERWEFNVTPFEWLWRASEPGSSGRDALSTIDIDHSVPPVPHARGGRSTSVRMLQEFLSNRLYRYADDRNQVKSPATSGLSPWFHFGHISTVEVIQQILVTNNWDPETIQMPRKGSREGWWNLDRAVESFLDQIITWRELGFNNAYHIPEHNQYESLPDWAKTTLMEHASDERVQYTLKQIKEADTHDEIWNAAQRQLVRDGIIHNYLRMLWGKRILEWSPSPQIAAEWMIELNDRFALDGR
ncbi:deoxyribodipyrimidine photolyase, partial [Euryarchaeota archaeon]|nr:deoxyribodipyrimidine photolyase [Euryarchaeota archaeon]